MLLFYMDSEYKNALACLAKGWMKNVSSQLNLWHC
jgi:hypothetical protein